MSSLIGKVLVIFKLDYYDSLWKLLKFWTRMWKSKFVEFKNYKPLRHKAIKGIWIDINIDT